MSRLFLGCLVLVTCLAGIAQLQANDSLPAIIEFNRDVRPILSDACWRCHGPDKNSRQGDLRLDTEQGAIGDHGSPGAIIRGAPQKSELIRRLTTADPGERMPPAESGKILSERQIAILKRWVEQGAKWEKHWAFLVPKKAELPAVRQNDWPRGAADYFVLAKLEQQKFAPSSPAHRSTLLRRVTLDLTGLPPTLEETDAFLADDRPDAYERLVDRLLASPRYGERMAIRWLEAARYADTSGYQSDGPRDMWRWRDWVIDAFNHNQPFDQFTVEQIAGDLLPQPTLDQWIATGFNRNHRGNSEGGIIPEEYAAEYVVDRVDTTCTNWLGLTMGCVRCHDHKFDPFTQRDYYQLFAIFNNVPEFGRAIKEGNSPPYIKAPTVLEKEKLEALQKAQKAAEHRVQELEPAFLKAQTAWEKSLAKNVDRSPENVLPDDYSVSEGLVAAFRLKDQSTLNAGDVGAFGYMDKFSLGLRVKPTGNSGGTLIGRMTDAHHGDGYYVQAVDGHVQVNLVKRWLDDAIRLETKSTLKPSEWQHVAITYDGSRLASGIQVYFDGRPQPLKVHVDLLNQTFYTKEPLRIGFGGGAETKFHGELDDARVFDRVLSTNEVEEVALQENLHAILKTPPKQRTNAQQRKLRGYFLSEIAPVAIQRAHQASLKLRRESERFADAISTVMVMQEMATPRKTRLLLRGEYDKPADIIQPDTPASLPRLPAGAKRDRLGFARWLVAAENPLTSRVIVNRLWQSVFGIGLVKTTEDFGSQGEVPLHQDMLDWLATELLESGWDLKAMQRLMVTNATYRQQSTATQKTDNVPLPKPATKLAMVDPENRLLGRGPRYRWPAEVIRDQALAASGLLVERLGGRSVKPYQPADFWKDLATDSQYVQSQGADLYRRSLYTFWKRTVSPPTLTTFDAMTRDTCTVKPTRTNTPLQALTLLNETTFVEAARVLAEKVLEERTVNSEAQIRLAFRLLLTREPTQTERTILISSLERHRAWYDVRKEEAEKLVQIGDLPRNPKLDVVELAAFTAVTSVILNLDEVVTKE